MQNKNYQIIHADCVEALAKMVREGVQVDSIVTDPPYEIGFMGREFDKTGIAHNIEMWKLCLQVLKPGGHLLAFAGARTYHRMVVAIEDAGFEIRDQIMWVYGSGFPKSLNISKAIDKMAGVERTEFYTVPQQYPDSDCWGVSNSHSKNNNIGFGDSIKDSTRKDQTGDGNLLKSRPATDLAKQWDGWGSQLKPAHEPIVLARKPLSEKNIVSNVLKHGTGGINIDGCRVEIVGDRRSPCGTDGKVHRTTGNIYGVHEKSEGFDLTQGRFPANLIHSCFCSEYMLKSDVTSEQKKQLLEWLYENSQCEMLYV